MEIRINPHRKKYAVELVFIMPVTAAVWVGWAYFLKINNVPLIILFSIIAALLSVFCAVMALLIFKKRSITIIDAHGVRRYYNETPEITLRWEQVKTVNYIFYSAPNSLLVSDYGAGILHETLQIIYGEGFQVFIPLSLRNANRLVEILKNADIPLEVNFIRNSLLG